MLTLSVFDARWFICSWIYPQTGILCLFFSLHISSISRGANYIEMGGGTMSVWVGAQNLRFACGTGEGGTEWRRVARPKPASFCIVVWGLLLSVYVREMCIVHTVLGSHKSPLERKICGEPGTPQTIRLWQHGVYSTHEPQITEANPILPFG